MFKSEAERLIKLGVCDSINEQEKYCSVFVYGAKYPEGVECFSYVDAIRVSGGLKKWMEAYKK